MYYDVLRGTAVCSDLLFGIVRFKKNRYKFKKKTSSEASTRCRWQGAWPTSWRDVVGRVGLLTRCSPEGVSGLRLVVGGVGLFWKNEMQPRGSVKRVVRGGQFSVNADTII